MNQEPPWGWGEKKPLKPRRCLPCALKNARAYEPIEMGCHDPAQQVWRRWSP